MYHLIASKAFRMHLIEEMTPLGAKSLDGVHSKVVRAGVICEVKVAPLAPTTELCPSR